MIHPTRLLTTVVIGLAALAFLLAGGGPQASAQQNAAEGVSVVSSCLGAGGRVDTNVHNTGAAAAVYRIEFGQLSAREITVAADDWGRMSITGRPAGQYRMIVQRDGVAAIDQIVSVDCTAEAPPVSSPEVQVLNSCRGGNGYFLFQFANPTGAPVPYVIITESVPNRSTTAAPYGAAVRAVTGRFDGDFDVTVLRNGTFAFTTTLTVACDGGNDGEPTPTPTPTPTPPAQPDLVWGYDATPPSATRTRPAFYAPTVDPVYGTTATRITSADGTRFNRNTYSRRQAENADGTEFFTYHGEAEYRVYERMTGNLVRVLDISPDAWPQWHPTDPDVIRYTSGANSYVGDLQLYEVDVPTGQSTVIADVTTRLQAALPGALYMHDRAEGSPSADGNRWAWMVYDEGEDVIGMASYDLSTDTLLGVLPVAQFPSSEPLDWVSASPTGDYVMGGHWDGTWAFDPDLGNARRVNSKADHSDIALNAAGRDAYVYIDFSAGTDGGWLVSVDLDTLARTRIFDLYDDANTSIHISGKGYAKPGWVVASTYNCKVPGAWSCEKVLAVELAPNGRVLNLAHTYNCGDEYWTETHAAVNRDFTRVYFNTDHGSCGIDAEVMLLDVPAFE